MKIRHARSEEWKQVRRLYWDIIDQMEHAAFHPGWQKEVYPSDEMIRTSIERRELYVLEERGEFLAAMVMNHVCTAGYEQILWAVEAKDEEVTVIHALGILPSRQGQGLARLLVKEAMELAAGAGQKAVRLDVLEGNVPAQRLYEGMGFQCRGTVRLFYEDTGTTDFKMYEAKV